jgi:CheY-specific phosphatase CheX
MANTRKIDQILKKAIFEVFEQMYYIFAESPHSSDGGDYSLRSSIVFSGSATGSMQILLSSGIAKSMGANVLSLCPDDVSVTVMEDCAKEAINMICGNFIRKLNPEMLFQLSIPTVETISNYSDEHRKAGDHELHLTFSADNGNMKVILASADIL